MIKKTLTGIPPIPSSLPNQYQPVLQAFGRQRYAAGLEDGIQITERILNMVLSQPPLPLEDIHALAQRLITRARSQT